MDPGPGLRSALQMIVWALPGEHHKDGLWSLGCAGPRAPTEPFTPAKPHQTAGRTWHPPSTAARSWPAAGLESGPLSSCASGSSPLGWSGFAHGVGAPVIASSAGMGNAALGAWGQGGLVPQPRAGVTNVSIPSSPGIPRGWPSPQDISSSPSCAAGSIPSGFTGSGSALATTSFSTRKTFSKFTLWRPNPGGTWLPWDGHARQRTDPSTRLHPVSLSGR